MATRIVIDETGGPEVLREEALPGPAEPGPGEVRIAQAAVGVNFIDTYHRSGLYPLPELPHGLGMEAAGIVEAVGPAVEGLRVGATVAYASGPPGAYASWRIMPADRVVPVPAEVSPEEAAAVMLKGMTVEYLIRRTFAVQPGMTVLFHAAAGGVGLIACQWLNRIGATVIGTVGSEEKAELAAAHGCHHPVVYTRDDFRERTRELTGGEGVAVVYDSVGRETFERSLDCLAPRGMMVSFGNASGPPPPLDPLILSRKGSLFLTRPTLMDYNRTREELQTSASALFDVVRGGAVEVRIGQRFDLTEAADAHRALESRGTTGSTVLIP